ncbi:MAG: ADOP family duplicated permease [Blastocatellia bacterium]
MPDWKQIVCHHLAPLRLPPEREIEIAEELAQHLEAVYEEALGEGATEPEARAQALGAIADGRLLECELSRVERPLTARWLPSEYLEGKGGTQMESLWQDLRYGARMLTKQPGFALIAVMTLALGIGANAAIFSLVNMVLLRPLPVAQPEQIVEVTPVLKGADLGMFSYPLYVDFRDRNEALAGLAAYRFAPMSLSRQGANERVWGYLVSGNYFDMLGVRAFRGRMFTQAEDRAPGAHPVAVVSYGSWQRRFGGDPALIGKTVTLNNHGFTVVGIAPPEFNGTVLIFTPEIYVPLMMARQIEPGSNWLENRRNGVLLGLGRLKPGVTAAQARVSLEALAHGMAGELPGIENLGFSLTPPGLIVPMLRTGTLAFAWVLLATVGLVLLIACTNLANLLLARAAARRKEIAVRLALGAGRFRLVRQLLTESVLLALLGGALGWLLASWLVRLAGVLKPEVDFPLTVDLRVDWRVLVFTLLVSLVTGALFGLVPAWQATKPDLIPALKDEGALAGAGRSRWRSGLVVAQIACSLVLLAAAGLIVRSLQQVRMAGPGFAVERTVTLSVDLGLQGYNEARGREFYRQLMARVEALPGVRTASYAGYLPLNLDRNGGSTYAEGQPYTRNDLLPEVLFNTVWPRYFETMDIPLLEGRDFRQQDGEARVAIVSEAFARRFWPGQQAVGKRLHRGNPERPAWEVIGVAKDSKYWSLGEDPQPYIYFPLAADYDESLSLLASTSAEPAGVTSAIRREVQQMDANLPVYDVKTMDEHLRLAFFPLRAGAWLAGGFALLTLALAGLGIYGVMSYAVSRRTREIGIRMALGAPAGAVMRLIVRQGMRLALVGAAIGLACALALTRLMTSVLYGVSATDGVTFALATALLMLVVLLACYVPARRAAQVDPLIALRSE